MAIRKEHIMSGWGYLKVDERVLGLRSGDSFVINFEHSQNAQDLEWLERTLNQISGRKFTVNAVYAAPCEAVADTCMSARIIRTD